MPGSETTELQRKQHFTLHCKVMYYILLCSSFQRQHTYSPCNIKPNVTQLSHPKTH